jgi:putative ATP-dependent endonuclease of OLD family
MKLLSIEIENFRCYENIVKVSFDNLTTFIGKNDIGKSSVLEALEIFFNNDVVQISDDDSNINSQSNNVTITCEFNELPESLILDSGHETTLRDEFLLTGDGSLKIKKTFDCSKKKPPVEICILANHPTSKGFESLLELKEKDLQARIDKDKIDCPKKGNPLMRKAIWESASDLEIKAVEIPLTKAKEDSKRIWEQIDKYLPMFALFQSDRSSKDSDGEVQDPMKAAVNLAIAEVQNDIDKIQKKVQERTEEIANNTHKALQSIDSGLANSLKPEFTPPTPAKWSGLFSVNLITDGIPLNKRGSGVRRLILVSFFKAEAERLLKKGNKKGIIYAIEEPETAQHPNNQKILQQSFMSLSEEDSCQVILTTHSPGFASDLPSSGVRFVTRDENGQPNVKAGIDVLGEVSHALGVTPDSRVRALCCVEGPTDVLALKSLSNALHQEDPSILNLDNDDRIAFIVLGGGNLQHWVNHNYLKSLGKPEIHIYDADVPKYQQSAQDVNQRDESSRAFITQKHEIESYLHSEAIKNAFGVEIEVTDHPNEDGKATPKVFSEAFSLLKNFDAVMGDTKAKSKLANKAFSEMTAAMIHERDPEGEIKSWLSSMSEVIK